jgi:hypothetical protein
MLKAVEFIGGGTFGGAGTLSGYITVSLPSRSPGEGWFIQMPPVR